MQIIKEKLIKSTMLATIIVLSLTALGVILFGVKQFKLSSQFASVNQVANISHILVRQQANLFSVLLTNNAKTEQLTDNLDQIVKEDFILDASLYDGEGKLLAQSREMRNSPDANNQQIVEPLYAQGGIKGFLRVTIDTQYTQSNQSKINQIFHQLYGELIIVFLLGAVMASSIHYFLSHYRRTYRKPKEKKSAVNLKVKSSSARFHQRRRRI
ncbi:hemolysin regulation protein AhpA [Haemophilus haemolyticus]|uniref:Hemolysin regulation protein AhpA n=1 Tax=Haemophilus haemolyticus TaxID=726 RepID=A0A502LEB9_HAEHA|nr:YtjB family periplasmic protein [Haemophilus haemolyticus]TPH21284.1 hemolysin regulation protein AhpA [Haemophilus haemolyticus]